MVSHGGSIIANISPIIGNFFLEEFFNFCHVTYKLKKQIMGMSNISKILYTQFCGMNLFYTYCSNSNTSYDKSYHYLFLNYGKNK